MQRRINVSIVPSAKNFTANLRREVGNQTSLGKSMGDSAGEGFAGALLSAAKRAAGVVAGYFAINKIIDVGVGAFNVAADFQQTRIAFEGLIGDVGAADAALRELQEFAASTPFDFEQVSEAGRKLLSFGFDASEIVPILTNIGNAAAHLGASSYDINLVTRALGQIGSKGRVQLEELNQIAEAFPGFNPIKALAEGIGVSTAEFTQKLSEPGGALVAFGLTGAQAVDILIESMGNMPGAAGAMERQAATLNGVMEKLVDTFKIIAIETLEPFMPGLASSIDSVIPLIESLGAHLPGLIQGGVDLLAQGFHDLQAAIVAATPFVVGLFDFVVRNQDAFAVAAAGVLAFVAASKTITTVSTTVSTVNASITAAGGIMSLLGSQLGSLAPILANPVGIVIALVAAVAAAFTVAYFKIEPFREAVDAVARVVRDFAVEAFERFVAILPSVGRFLADVGARLVSAGRAIAEFALVVRDGAVAGFRAFIDAAGNVASDVIEALTPLAAWVDENLISTFLAAADFVDAFVDLATNNLRNFFGAVGDVASAILGFLDLPNVFNVIAGVVLDVLIPAFRFAGRVVSGTVDVFAALVRVVLPIVEVFARGVWEAIQLNFIILKNIVEAGLGVLRGLFTLFAGIFRGDWERIWRGLTTIVTSVFGSLYDIVVGILNAVKDVLVAGFQNVPELVGALFNLVATIGDHLANITLAVASWIAQTLTQVILPGMVSWAGGLTEWFVTTAIPWFLEKSAVFVGTFIQWIIDTAATTAAQVVDWAVAVTDWMVTTALPWIISHSAEFTVAMIQWVIDTAAGLAAQAVDLAVAITEWLVTKAIPWAVENSAKLLTAFIGWITDSAVRIASEAVKLATALVGWIADEVPKIPGRLEGIAGAIIGFIQGLPQRISAAAVGMWDGIYTAFIGAINSIIGAWNRLSFTLPSVNVDWNGPLPGGNVTVGGFTLSTPNIPYLAEGGVVTSPTLAMLAEIPAARPEIVTPERLMRQVVRDAIAEAGSQEPAGGVGELRGNVYLNGQELQRSIVRWERAGR